MAISATYVDAATFSATYDAAGQKDLREQCAPGVKIRADCGPDGTRYGVVAAVAYADPVTTIILAGEGLTPNLTAFEHGNDTPGSLPEHGHAPAAVGLGRVTDDAQVRRDEMGRPDGVATLGPDGLVPAGQLPSSVDAAAVLRLVASLPAHYARSALAGVAGTADAAGRRTLALPGRITVNVGEAGYALSGLPPMDLNAAANWDAASPDYANPANRAGKDLFVYACVQADGTARLLFSANATFPAGYDAATSRKIMGFHCLCLSVGTIDGHALSGFATGDILPASIWDLGHRSAGDQAGRVYSPVAGGKWGMIYLPSVSGGKLLSAYGGTIACGDSTPAFHWFKFTQWLGAQGERPMTQMEFVAFSLGSNQGSALGGTVKPATTGGHVDTNGRRMVSDIGCEDCCGVLFQWGAEAGGGAGGAGYINAFDANDYGVLGQHTQAPNRVAMGGNWSTGTLAGTRCSNWTGGPLTVGANTATRGVSEPLAGGI
uniref:Major tropism determinant second domain-containing protein n=1 Tax=Desulfovibrio sp. U5L TaxID=596152 RepID=I2PYP4_9BACT